MLLQIILGGLVTTVVGYWIYFQYRIRTCAFKFNDGKIVPGPTPSFPFGNATILLPHIQQELHGLRMKYGETFQFWLGPNPFLYVQEIDEVHRLAADKNFAFRLSTSGNRWLTGSNGGIVFNNEADSHKLHRSIALKGLMKTSTLKNTVGIINEKTEHLLNLLAKNASENAEKGMEVEKLMNSLTFDVIGKAAFSRDMNAVEGNQAEMAGWMESMTKGLLYFLGKPLPPPLYRSKFNEFITARNNMEATGMKWIAQRKQSGEEKGDFMDFLIEEKDPKTGQQLKDYDIARDIVDLLIAGHETTSHSLCFALHYLALHLDWQQKLQEEADSVSTNPSYDDASHLKVADAVFKETLRRFAIASIVIRTYRGTESTLISNVIVPPGSPIMFSQWSLGRDPKYWKDPLQWNPQRFLNVKEEEVKQVDGNNFAAWMPFGAGTRSCVGSRLATLEAKIILIKLMQKYSVRPTDYLQDDIPYYTGVTLGPVGLKLKFIPRKK